MKPSLFVSSVRSNIQLPKTRLRDVASDDRNDGLNHPLARKIDLPGHERIIWRFITTRGTGNVQMKLSNKKNINVICLTIPAMADFLAFYTSRDSMNLEFEFGISLS